MAKGKDLKPHIGIFGRRNNGKSSFINALVGQEVAIVSDHAGTTTDPVKKSVEIFGVGPAIIIDTAGIDGGFMASIMLARTSAAKGRLLMRFGAIDGIFLKGVPADNQARSRAKRVRRRTGLRSYRRYAADSSFVR